MRGQPVHGFRLTKQRMARGVTSSELMTKMAEIQEAERLGKKLTASQKAAKAQIQKNIKLVQTKRLLGPSIDGLHPVEKSALRRQALQII